MQTESRPDTLEVKQWKTRRKGEISIWDPKIIRAAIPASFQKLDPRVQLKNPVMFVVEVGSVVTTVEFVRLLFTAPTPAFPRTTLTYETIFVLAVAIWLWFTVVFANFAEAMAEGRGKAQAETLRRARTTTMAKRLLAATASAKWRRWRPRNCARATWCWSRPGMRSPAMATSWKAWPLLTSRPSLVKSAPVIRESGGDRSAVTGGTRVLSDWIVVQISCQPRRDLPGSHDRPGRRRQAAANAQ